MTREFWENLEKLLTAMEFSGRHTHRGSEWTGNWSTEACPICDGEKYERHSVDCPLFATLTEVRKMLELT